MNKTKKQKLISYSIDLLVFILIYIAVNLWQSRSLLSTSSETPVPQFTLQTLDNKPVTIGAPADNDSLLFFFAPWCQVCSLNEQTVSDYFSGRGPKDRKVYAVALAYESIDNIKKYTKDHDLKIPVLIGNDQVMAAYKVSSFPTYYFIDKTGMLESTSVGYTTRLGIFIRELF